MATNAEQWADDHWPIDIHSDSLFTHYLEPFQVLDGAATCEDTGLKICSTRRQAGNVKRQACRCGHYRIIWRAKRVNKNPFRKGSSVKHHVN